MLDINVAMMGRKAGSEGDGELVLMLCTFFICAIGEPAKSNKKTI